MNSPATSGGALSEHTLHEIDRWLAKFPPDRRRSAVLAALREAQHQNGGFLTTPLMDAVAEYIGMPAIADFGSLAAGLTTSLAPSTSTTSVWPNSPLMSSISTTWS